MRFKLIGLLFLTLLRNTVTADENSSRNVYLQKKIVEKTLLYYSSDIAKYCVKSLILYQIEQRMKVPLVPYIRNSTLVDYALEGAWGGYCNGFSKIPHALVRYALVDSIYNQVSAGTHLSLFKQDQPFLQSLSWYILQHLACMAFGKSIIGHILDFIVDIVIKKNDTDDEQNSFSSDDITL